MKIKIKNIVYSIILILVVIVPTHYYLCELLLKEMKLDNLLRDFLILIALVICIACMKIKNRVDIKVMFFNTMILLCYAFISYIQIQKVEVFNILRTYLLPMLFYFVCSSYNFSEKQFVKLQRIIVAIISLIAIYGFFQAFFLGDDFIIHLGYPSKDGFLDSTSYYIGGFWGYQRNVGTFVSPNICGAIISIGLLIILTDKKIYIKKGRYFFCGCLVVGLLATLSRSAIVGCMLAIFFYIILTLNERTLKKVSQKHIIAIPIAIASVLMMVVIDLVCLEGLFVNMLKSSFLSTVTGTDPSMGGHLNDLVQPINKIIRNPFGLGFGKNGPMAIEYMENANVVESSLYLIIYEIGIIPAILFFCPYVKVVIDTIKHKKKYKFYTPMVVSIVILFTYVLLPNVQTFEILFYSFMYIGFYYNNSVREIYSCKEKIDATGIKE